MANDKSSKEMEALSPRREHSEASVNTYSVSTLILQIKEWAHPGIIPEGRTKRMSGSYRAVESHAITDGGF